VGLPARSQLDFNVERYTNLATQASVIAGFSFESLVELEVPEGTHWALAGCYFIFGSAAMALALYCLVVASFACVFGHRLALQGPHGSLEIAVSIMIAHRTHIFAVGGCSLFCLVMAAVLMSWIKMGAAAGVVTLIFLIFAAATFHRMVHMAAVFEIKDIDLVTGAVRIADPGSTGVGVDLARLNPGSRKVAPRGVGAAPTAPPGQRYQPLLDEEEVPAARQTVSGGGGGGGPFASMRGFFGGAASSAAAASLSLSAAQVAASDGTMTDAGSVAPSVRTQCGPSVFDSNAASAAVWHVRVVPQLGPPSAPRTAPEGRGAALRLHEERPIRSDPRVRTAVWRRPGARPRQSSPTEPLLTPQRFRFFAFAFGPPSPSTGGGARARGPPLQEGRGERREQHVPAALLRAQGASTPPSLHPSANDAPFGCLYSSPVLLCCSRTPSSSTTRRGRTTAPAAAPPTSRSQSRCTGAPRLPVPRCRLS